ncbi:MAG: OmpA family protein [Fibrobacteres bacterium]|nr:OmpA family protein [Fibrobacterota bacterium]
MIRSTIFRLLIATAALSLIFASCSRSKQVKRPDGASTDSTTQQSSNKTGSSQDELTPVHKDSLTTDETEQLKKLMASLEDIPFDFDSYNIPEKGREVVKQNAEILNTMLAKRGKYIKITLEGHTDERGSEEYNLALGDRRAKTVKDYLNAVGFTEKQLRIISYGKEKPKVDESTVEAWAANRRVHIAVE